NGAALQSCSLPRWVDGRWWASWSGWHGGLGDLPVPEELRRAQAAVRPPRQHEQGVRQSVQVNQHLGPDVLLRAQCMDKAFGAPANRAGQVQCRGRLCSSGEDEIL